MLLQEVDFVLPGVKEGHPAGMNRKGLSSQIVCEIDHLPQAEDAGFPDHPVARHQAHVHRTVKGEVYPPAFRIGLDGGPLLRSKILREEAGAV